LQGLASSENGTDVHGILLYGIASRWSKSCDQQLLFFQKGNVAKKNLDKMLVGRNCWEMGRLAAK
jgi:hypothetical protein